MLYAACASKGAKNCSADGACEACSLPLRPAKGKAYCTADVASVASARPDGATDGVADEAAFFPAAASFSLIRRVSSSFRLS